MRDITDLPEREAFAAQLGTQFSIAAADASPIQLELVEAAALPQHPGQQREPFSLLFRGPAGLGQGTYALQHAALGEQALFLVPIAPDETSARYEAVFG